MLRLSSLSKPTLSSHHVELVSDRGRDGCHLVQHLARCAVEVPIVTDAEDYFRTLLSLNEAEYPR